MNTITISFEHYDFMVSRCHKLAALEAAGVDNWEGYSPAMEDYHTDVVEYCREIEGD